MEKRHFWLSVKAEEQRRMFHPSKEYWPRIVLLDTGEKIEYSFITDTPDDHRTKWDDVVYLGTGRIYSINGKIQGQGEGQDNESGRRQD